MLANSRLLLSTGLSICLFLSVAAGGAQADQIESFMALGRLDKSGVMDVTETIKCKLACKGRHSIYRIIPTQYTTPDTNRVHRFDVKVTRITDGKGHKIKFSMRNHDGAVAIKLDRKGHEHVHEFKLAYQVRGALNFDQKHPQLLWDVTGHDFAVPVGRAEVIVYPPPETTVVRKDLKAWKDGSDGQTAVGSAVKSDHVFATATNLPSGESLTIQIDLPIGSINEPGLLDQAKWILSDWYLLVVLPLLVVLAIWLYRWIRVKFNPRDTEPGSIFEPPENLRPVEIGTLIDQQCDVSDVSVTLLNLAVRGHYTIREIPSTGFFALSDRDYEFKKLTPPKGDPLKEYESIFIDAIFGNSLTSYLSNIQGIFRQYLPKIRTSIYQSLVKDGYMVKDPQKDRKKFGSVGASLVALGIALLLLYSESSMLKAAGLGLILSGAIVSVSPFFLPLKTEKGLRATDRIHQFAETLRTAQERDIVERLNEDRYLFHKLLPYAIILGVFEKWASACESEMELSPDWFQFHDAEKVSAPFSASLFAKDVWVATKIAGLTFTAPPPRQYSSHTVGKFGARKEQEHDE